MSPVRNHIFRPRSSNIEEVNLVKSESDRTLNGDLNDKSEKSVLVTSSVASEVTEELTIDDPKHIKDAEKIIKANKKKKDKDDDKTEVISDRSDNKNSK